LGDEFAAPPAFEVEPLGGFSLKVERAVRIAKVPPLAAKVAPPVATPAKV
jgi:hypothetical protein